LGLVGALSPSRPACAQTANQAAVERRGPVSPEERAELYRQLKGQAEILEAQAAVVKTVAKLIGPTVVHIEAGGGRAALQYGQGPSVEEFGAGVVIRWKDGHYVLTSRHVIAGAAARAIRIHLADGRLIHPRKVMHDTDTDVAVLAVDAPDLVAAPLGDSDAMEVGDFVLAVGSPFGERLSYSFTFGIVSAKGRRGLDLGDGRRKNPVRLQNFIQTDASVNPGNSGGPLVNLRGEVIGVNTAIASNSGGSAGVAFATPINMFMFVARQLIEQGHVRRAFLGVTLDREFEAEDAMAAGLPRLMGAKVTQVTGNSPAAAAELKVGDVILQVDDTPIEDDNHLVNVISMTEIGKEVDLVVVRNRKQIKAKAAVTLWKSSQ
jgi:serine protease Do